MLLSRERVACALRGKRPDRVPMRYNGRIEVDEVLARYLGIPLTGDWHERMMRELGIDVRNVGVPALKSSARPAGKEAQSSTAPKPPAEALAAVEAQLEAGWRVEDLDAEPLLAMVRKFDADGNPPWLVAGISGPWSRADYLLGLEQTLIGLALRDPTVLRLLDRLTELACRDVDKTAAVLGSRVDMVYLGDDLGTQRGPLISPEMTEELLMPLYRRIGESIHSAGVVFCVHCCGAIHEMISQFIDVGVEVLNPIQPCRHDMHPEVLARDFGGRIAFCGGIDMQRLLPFGTPQQVADEVRRYIRVLGADGRYLLDSANILHTDVPPENIEALFRAGREFRLN